MSLLLGPVLRHVDESSAVVWVQCSHAGTVAVLGTDAPTAEAPTFEVAGYHFALVTVTGLAPGSTTEYRVELDGEQVWPPAGHPFPPSVIRARGGPSGLRALFGSCRYPKTGEPDLEAHLGLDALDCYAARMVTEPPEQWPDLLILLGDQVYADELTPSARRTIAGRRAGRRHGRRPPDEVVSFDEYVKLYEASWSDPEIRWLMSTVPTAMIFDDHDVRDDWNTSAAWRAEMAETSWWPERIRAALASYWVFQHLGNLPPADLAEDTDYRAVLAAGGDRWPLLAELADRADRETDGAKGVRFSYRWELGRARLVMADSRNGRILDGGRRAMIGDREFDWIERQILDGLDGLDHLILGSSLPWLLPPAISELQSVNERAARRPGWRGRLAEKIRQATDMEHWAAFHVSFRRLTELVGTAAAASPGPATVSVLSGDVHHSYAARAELPGSAAVHQLVCSPVHNHVQGFMHPVFRLGWARVVASVMRRWARHRDAPEAPLRWRRRTGPLFGNTIATLRLDGREAEVLFEQPTDSAALDVVARLSLTGPDRRARRSAARRPEARGPAAQK
ncbi:MAG TPA: alkaline phosphatase D family protein [Pseudonocardia sp.]